MVIERITAATAAKLIAQVRADLESASEFDQATSLQRVTSMINHVRAMIGAGVHSSVIDHSEQLGSLGVAAAQDTV